MKRSITDRLAKTLKPQAGERTEVVDAQVPGLRLRANRDGSRVWSLLATGPNGKKYRVTLGSYPALSVAKARVNAGAMKQQIRDGYNPTHARQAAIASTQAEDNAITLENALELYDTAHLSTLRSGASIKRDFERDFGKLMAQKANTIAPRQIAEIIDTKARKHQTMARRLHAYGRAWFNWLVSRQYVESNPFEKLIAPGAEKARERVLSSEEVGAIWNALPGIGAPFSHCFRVLLLTGQRRQEVAGMRRDELDFEAKTWTVPAERSKTGRALRVPLPEMVIAEIEAAINASKSDVLIFSTTGDTSISGFSRAKERLDSAVQGLLDQKALEKGEPTSAVPGWRLHDFRRTMVSAMADMGIDATVADRCLNHRASATMSTVQRVYQQSDLFKQRQYATNAWAALVLEWAENKKSDNVLLYDQRSK